METKKLTREEALRRFQASLEKKKLPFEFNVEKKKK